MSIWYYINKKGFKRLTAMYNVYCTYLLNGLGGLCPKLSLVEAFLILYVQEVLTHFIQVKNIEIYNYVLPLLIKKKFLFLNFLIRQPLLDSECGKEKRSPLENGLNGR